MSRAPPSWPVTSTRRTPRRRRFWGAGSGRETWAPWTGAGGSECWRVAWTSSCQGARTSTRRRWKRCSPRTQLSLRLGWWPAATRPGEKSRWRRWCCGRERGRRASCIGHGAGWPASRCRRRWWPSPHSRGRRRRRWTGWHCARRWPLEAPVRRRWPAGRGACDNQKRSRRMAAQTGSSSRSLEPSEPHMELTAAASEFLRATEDRLGQVLTRAGSGVAASDTLGNAARHLCIGGGGKRLRPLMVHLFGRAVGAPPASLLHVGVAAELVHSASLLHDDVVDQGMFRRGRPTVNALWGNIVAVMGGDLLLCVALDELSTLDRAVTASAVATVAEMTRATIGEVEARGDLSLPPEQLRAIAEGKTGALFGFCGAAAATLTGKPEVARRFDTFGRHLGVAFQIADDLKDLTGGDPGKAPFADIRSRTPSLPLLLAAKS